MLRAQVIPLALLTALFVGCGGNYITRPAQPVVADVTIHVPQMT